MLPDFLSPIVMPVEIPTEQIADEAMSVTFDHIAEALGEHGYRPTGDIAPHEVHYLHGLFVAMVHTLARNDPTIAALQDRDEGYESN